MNIALALMLLGAAAEEPWTEMKRGEPIGKSPVVELHKLLAEPAAYEGKTIVTEGEVKAACSRKGCWMEMAAGDKACRVTFKDYGFFVPKDAQGARARVEARVEVKKLPAKMVEHYKEEGASIATASDGSAQEIRLVASGVELKRPAAQKR